ncbi:MAG TPA: alcohol dehydrogenase catalytic domain-containing protein [Blastocatellia bacterium]|nr:alcohol dehydrogenase catalytic domain-containing protein [Blastocatellia bacterium]
MQAIVFDGNLKLQEVPRPSNSDEAIIKVSRVGICNTDIEIIQGYAGFNGILGHEFVGVVESAPNDDFVGERVVGEINAGCGVCDLCAGGDSRHCPNRTVLGIVNRSGAMAEYISLPVSNLLSVPESVSDEEAVFTEPLAAACEILEQIRVSPSHKVAVIGDGKLGLLIAQVLDTTGCNLTHIGKHANKLEITAQRGIPTLLVDEAKGRFDSDFDIVVEASGAGSGFKLAQEIVRPRGTIVMKSTIHGDVPFDAARIIVNEITLIGSRCGRFENALALLEQGKVDVKPLISKTFPLSDGVEAINYAQQSGIMKVQLTT